MKVAEGETSWLLVIQFQKLYTSNNAARCEESLALSAKTIWNNLLLEEAGQEKEMNMHAIYFLLIQIVKIIGNVIFLNLSSLVCLCEV